MRKTNSLFNKACQFINRVPVGSTFTSKEYIAAIGKYEKSTRWKIVNGNKHYNCHQYKGYLCKAGFISQISHGVWSVDRHIPDWFDLGHLSILLGYYKWDYVADAPIETYKGMKRNDIIAQLDEDTHRAMGLIPAEKKNLRKLYAFNQEVYDTFVGSCHFLEIDHFDTKNALAAFIENIKWPGVGNNGVKPKFSVKGNYSPIIDNLIANGILTEKFDGYRYSYSVNLDRVSEAYHHYQDPEDREVDVDVDMPGTFVPYTAESSKNLATSISAKVPPFAGTTVTQTFRYNTPENADALYGTHPYGKENSLSELKKIEAELISLTQRVQQIIKNYR